ncbi:MAG: hypothetical protein WBN93_02245 [Acidimicrobiia bacterium]
MRPDVPQHLIERATEWDELHGWERSELGKTLRRLGLTYGEIRTLIPVPKATLSYWCRDIRLSPDQIVAIKVRSGAGARRGVPIDTQHRRRIELERIRVEARAFATQRLDDSFFVVGVALYWGEGAKTRNSCSLTNADPAVLRTFVSWVRSYLDADAQFVLSLHLHEGNDDNTSQTYWREQTGLLEAPFTKTYFKHPGTGHRKNHLPHGICRVRVRSPSDHWNRIVMWIDVVASHFGPLPIPA